ncbi:MAG: LysM peptidoglycan-binding domain-containing protein, partial [Muribaculaceae bacterium]|nr:LysM peptidoglycan-binding domain-containing protein [Muribaculaceae bacterium]
MTILRNIYRYMVVTVALAIGAATAAAHGIGSLPTVTVGSHHVHYYEVKRGDNLYTIAERLGVSRDFIVANNPSAADGVKPQMRLYFPMKGAAETSAVAAAQSTEAAIPATHVVGKGESIYGISALYGVPVETLIRLNPQADSGIKAGQILLLTDTTAQQAVSGTGSAPQSTAEKAAQEKKNKKEKKNKHNSKDPGIQAEPIHPGLTDTLTPDTIRVEESADTLRLATPANEAEASIVVLLPFQANETSPGRSAQLHTEFLRGMMLAAEKASHLPGAKITLRAFDTCNDTDTLRSLLTRPEVYTADIIIAPDSPAHIAAIEEGAPQARILNFLSVRDNSYLTHPNMVQANIPHDDMYA